MKVVLTSAPRALAPLFNINLKGGETAKMRSVTGHEVVNGN